MVLILQQKKIRKKSKEKIIMYNLKKNMQLLIIFDKFNEGFVPRCVGYFSTKKALFGRIEVKPEPVLLDFKMTPS